MGERLQGEDRTRMQSVIKKRLQAMSDVPICHCECQAWRHDVEAEMVAGEVVIIVEGHPANYTFNCSCPGYEPGKDGFDRILQDVARGIQEFKNSFKESS